MKIKVLLVQVGIEARVKDEKLFLEAFTHRSAVNENPRLVRHNERLEFLGDAVLELVTTDFLYKKFDRPEGELTNFRAALVKKDNLAKVARKLDLGKFLILSRGEEESGGAGKDYLLANTFEAFVGAIYLTQGLEVAHDLIQKYVLCDLDEIIEGRHHVDAKSEFQEITQGKLGITPHYKVASESGKDHEKTFVIEAFLESKKVGKGEGSSKKEAQVAAAANALKNRKKWLKK